MKKNNTKYNEIYHLQYHCQSNTLYSWQERGFKIRKEGEFSVFGTYVKNTMKQEPQKCSHHTQPPYTQKYDQVQIPRQCKFNS